jgi:hypothetical protein
MSNKAELAAWRAMIGQAVERVEALHKDGKTLEQAVAAKPLADFNRESSFINGEAFVKVIWASLAD